MTEENGLVFALALDGKGGASAVPAETFAGSLPAWMHLDYTSKNARCLLEAQGLESYVIDTLVRFESRPHTVAVGEGLLVVLRGINRNAGADPEDMVSIRIWVEPGRILTVRQRPIMAAQAVRAELEEGRGPDSITELLIAIIAGLADGIAMFVDDIEARMDTCEDAVEEGRGGSVRSTISGIRRQVAAVRRYLAPQRDSLESLNRLANRFLNAEQVFELRELSDRVTRYIEDLDLVRERALVSQEELMNRVAEQQNTRTYLFTVVATIFLPITFISGVFGMNTADLPGLEGEHAFWYVAGAMGAIAAAVTVWLRLKRWF